MTDPILLGTLYGTNHALRQTANNYADKIGELYNVIAARDHTIVTQKIDYASLATHYRAIETERDYLLKLLDEAYGADKNPARKHAYPESEQFRIPAGPRKGERLTMRDHIYFERFISYFNKHYSSLASSWKSFIDYDMFE